VSSPDSIVEPEQKQSNVTAAANAALKEAGVSTVVSVNTVSSQQPERVSFGARVLPKLCKQCVVLEEEADTITEHFTEPLRHFARMTTALRVRD